MMRTCGFHYHPRQGWAWNGAPALNGTATLVIVFGAPAYGTDPAVWKQLAAAFPQSAIFGCSSAGEIRGCEIADDSISGLAIRFDHSRVRRACAAVPLPSESRAAGRELAGRLAEGDLKAVLVLSDGLSVNGTELVKGLNEVLPEGVSVAGGLAADRDRFERTWVVTGAEPSSHRVAAVGLYGDRVHVSHGCKGGWDKFGPERRVTRSEGAVLYELDNRPALALYRQYLGDRAAGLPATGLLFPLAIRPAEQPETALVRTILKVDEAAQSLTFAGDVPTGSHAQLMMANFERLIQGASEAAEMAVSPQAMAPGGVAIAISCVGRRLVLGERSVEEIEATLAALPPGTNLLGFYSYGEISPYARTGSCELHNQTMTLTLIHES